MAKEKILYQFTRKNMVLVARHRRLPNGHPLDLEMITHPGAVCIVPFLNSKQIVLMRQYRAAVDSYLYELPAGTLDDNENPLTCAQRELKEETGYSAKSWKKVGKIFPLPAVTVPLDNFICSTSLKDKPFSLYRHPFESLIATIFAPASSKCLNVNTPTLPKPSIATVAPWIGMFACFKATCVA